MSFDVANLIEEEAVPHNHRFFSLFPYRKRINKVLIGTFIALFVTSLLIFAIGSVITNKIYADLLNQWAITGGNISQSSIDGWTQQNNIANVFYSVGAAMFYNIPLFLMLAILPLFRIKATGKTIWMSIYIYLTSILLMFLLAPLVDPSHIYGYSFYTDDAAAVAETTPYMGKLWGMNFYSGITWTLALIVPLVMSLTLRLRNRAKNKVDDNTGRTKRLFIYYSKYSLFLSPILIALFLPIIFGYLSSGIYNFGLIVGSAVEAGNLIWTSFVFGMFNILLIPFGLNTTFLAGFSTGSLSVSEAGTLEAITGVTYYSTYQVNNMSLIMNDFLILLGTSTPTEQATLLADVFGSSNPNGVLTGSVPITYSQLNGNDFSGSAIISMIATMAFVITIIAIEWWEGTKVKFEVIMKNIYFILILLLGVQALILMGFNFSVWYILLFLAPLSLFVISILAGLIYMIPAALGITVSTGTSSILVAASQKTFLVAPGSWQIPVAILVVIALGVLTGILFYAMNMEVHKLRVKWSMNLYHLHEDEAENLLLNSKRININVESFDELIHSEISNPHTTENDMEWKTKESDKIMLSKPKKSLNHPNDKTEINININKSPVNNSKEVWTTDELSILGDIRESNMTNSKPSDWTEQDFHKFSKLNTPMREKIKELSKEEWSTKEINMLSQFTDDFITTAKNKNLKSKEQNWTKSEIHDFANKQTNSFDAWTPEDASDLLRPYDERTTEILSNRKGVDIDEEINKLKFEIERQIIDVDNQLDRILKSHSENNDTNTEIASKVTNSIMEDTSEIEKTTDNRKEDIEEIFTKKLKETNLEDLTREIMIDQINSRLDKIDFKKEFDKTVEFEISKNIEDKSLTTLIDESDKIIKSSPKVVSDEEELKKALEVISGSSTDEVKKNIDITEKQFIEKQTYALLEYIGGIENIKDISKMNKGWFTIDLNKEISNIKKNKTSIFMSKIDKKTVRIVSGRYTKKVYDFIKNEIK